MSVAYDCPADLRALDVTFSGIRGLVASGITILACIFCLADWQHPQPPRSTRCQEPTSYFAATVPVIDLSSANRAADVWAIRRAATEWGFFQVPGHGVAEPVMAAAVGAVQGFHIVHRGKGSDKARLYWREPARALKYHCNFDLYQSQVANRRDTLYLRMTPDRPHCGDLPDSSR